jgi:hypothetical protein
MNFMKIIRVFLRMTNATPTDEDVRVDSLPGLFDQEWKRFQRQWANPIITAANCKKIIP